MDKTEFDQIHYWTEMKLEIIEKYAQEYARILSNQSSPRLHYVYIDAFSGAGQHVSEKTGEIVPGSPSIALSVKPPFKHYYFIDLNSSKADHLRNLAKNRSDVSVFEGDCNEILLREVFCNVLWNDYRRGLCLLDPYGLDLNWAVLEAAGQMKSIEVFLNFPVMDANRNVLWRDGTQLPEYGVKRMNAFWGDDSWKKTVYIEQGDLFGKNKNVKSLTNWEVAQVFKARLQKVAGFAKVPDPIPMRNSVGSVVYYLFFASQRPVAAQIVDYIFRKYEKYGNN